VDVIVGPNDGTPFVLPSDRFRYVTGKHTDLVAVDGAGALWRYPGNGAGGFATRTKPGSSGWNGFTALLGPGDMNGDGHVDIVARDSTGRLWLYPGTGTGTLSARVLIGTGGWNIYTALVGPGDMDGDGHPDLVARDSGGKLWLYKGSGTGGVALPRILIGNSGWNTFNALLGPGDMDGDGHPDLVARDSGGKLWLYKGSGTGGVVLPRILIGSGWNSFTALPTPGDFDGDGKVDLVGRDSSGALWLYSGAGNGFLGGRMQIGSGWNGFSAIVGVGDMAT